MYVYIYIYGWRADRLGLSSPHTTLSSGEPKGQIHIPGVELGNQSLAARYLEKKTRRCFDSFCTPLFLFPRVHPRLTRRWIKTSALGFKNWVYCNF